MELTPVTVCPITGKYGQGKTTRMLEILTINNNGNLIYNGIQTPVITSESYKHIDSLIEPKLKEKKVDYVYLKGLTQLCKKAKKEEEKVNFLYSIGIETTSIHETYLQCEVSKCPYKMQKDLDLKDKIILTVFSYALNKEFFNRLYIGIDEIDGLFEEDKEIRISDTDEGEFAINSTELFNGWRKVKPEVHNKWLSDHSNLIKNKDYKWCLD